MSLLRRRVFVVLSLAVIPVRLPRFAAAQAPLQPVAGIDEKGSRLFVAAESAHQILVCST